MAQRTSTEGRRQSFFLHLTPETALTTLLVITAVGLFVLPLFPLQSRWIDVAVTIEILSALAIVMGVRKLRFFAVVVATAAILGQLMPAGSSTAQALWPLASRLVLIVVVGGVISHRVFEPGSVTVHRIAGAVLLYMLVGIAFSLVYEIIDVVDPGSFSGLAANASSPSFRNEFTYFSFMTLTTVGYGDIHPLFEHARRLAVLEALIGQLYPAITLARLVSLNIMDTGRS